MKIPYSASPDNVTVIFNSRHRQVSLSTDRGQKLLAALRKSVHDVEEISVLLDIPTYVAKLTLGRVEIGSDDKIRIDKREVDYGLKNIILRVLTESGDAGYLAAFLENVDQNPDKNIAGHVYSFLEKGDIPLTSDGCFLAFKRVQSDYKSFHTGKETVWITSGSQGLNPVSGAYFDSNRSGAVSVAGQIPHNVGTVLSLNRDLCDADRNRTCSVGLHACSYAYLPNYCNQQGRVMIVKINPRDVTAIPSDYNDTKLRTCRLEVVDEVPESEIQTRFTTATEDTYDNPDEDEDQEEDCEADVTLEEAQEWAKEDAEYDLMHDTIEGFNPENGNRFSEVPEHLQRAYFVMYTMEFEDGCELSEFYSEKALSLGLADGLALAVTHKANDVFDPSYSDGEQFYSVPADFAQAYIIGFLRGYLKGGVCS